MVNQSQFLSLVLSWCTLNCYQKGSIIFKEANMKFFSSLSLGSKELYECFSCTFFL